MCAEFKGELREGYVKVRDGKLFYKQFGSGKIPIIVVHGDPRLGFNYLLPEMLALSSHYDMVFFDQRGSGKSQATQISSEFISKQQFIEDLEDLRKHLSIKKFVLLGHSLGGPLALNYAVSYSERLYGLILMNSTPISTKGKDAYEKCFSARISSHLNKDYLNLLHNFQNLDKNQIETLYNKIVPLLFYNKEKAKKFQLEISASAMKNGDKAIELMSSTLAPINRLELNRLFTPCLIIHCTNDAIPLWTAEEIKNCIPSSCLLVLKKCDHFPYIEQPEILFRAIVSFLYNSGIF